MLCYHSYMSLHHPRNKERKKKKEWKIKSRKIDKRKKSKWNIRVQAYYNNIYFRVG